MWSAMSDDLYRALFNPKSVAVIGASRNPHKFGHIQLRNLLEWGFKGRVYAVNPKAKEILGVKCYSSILEIPDEVETAIISIPAPIVPQVMRECAKKGVKLAVVISSGFREAGEAGEKYEQEMLEAARASGLRIVGPNTTGIVCASTRFTTTFLPVTHVKQGPVTFIAQTGVFAGVLLLHIITSEHFGLAKVIGLGNKCDVEDAELLEYLKDDPETGVIAIYMEGVKDGRRFLEALKRTTPKKPVIILKSGRTEWGAKIALSHTGSLAGRDEIFDAVCRQAGAIRVKDFEELLDYIKAFAMQPIPDGDKVIVVSYSGAGCVTAVDHIAEYGMTPATLSDEALEELGRLYPPWARPSKHHVDAEPIFENIGPETYSRVLDVLARDENVDAVVVDVIALSEEHSDSVFYVEKDRLVDAFLQARKLAPKKPLLAVVNGEKKTVGEYRDALEEAGIPVYPSLSRAVRAISAMCRYSRFRRRLAGPTRP